MKTQVNFDALGGGVQGDGLVLIIPKADIVNVTDSSPLEITGNFAGYSTIFVYGMYYDGTGVYATTGGSSNAITYDTKMKLPVASITGYTSYRNVTVSANKITFGSSYYGNNEAIGYGVIEVVVLTNETMWA